jgi:hypothetical protein
MPAAFLLGLLFHPEDGSDMFLWNVGWLSMDYTALHPTRSNSSWSVLAFFFSSSHHAICMYLDPLLVEHILKCVSVPVNQANQWLYLLFSMNSKEQWSCKDRNKM